MADRSTRDVTTQKRAEAALRESEGRFRALTENSSLAVGVSSSDGKFLYLNRAYEKLFGYTLEELNHLNASELWRNPEDRREMIEAVKAKGFLMAYEVELKRKDGTPFWAMLSVNSVDYGGHQAIMASVYDITARKQAEEALRESEERYKAIIDNQSEFLARYRAGGIITLVNNSLCQFFNCKPEDFIGRSFLQYIHEDERERIASGVASLNEEHPTYIAEARVILPDGRVTIQNWTHRALFDAHGNIVEYQCNGRDITERTRAEEALRESGERLERAQEMAHLGSWELDVPRNRLIWSAEVFRIFGLKPEEFDATYQAFLEAVHPEDRAAVNEAFSQALRQGRDAYENEYRIIRRDNGETRFVRSKAENTRDENGRIVRSIGLVLDITEQKKTEGLRQALAEQERIRLGAAVEQASDSVVMFDLDGTIRYANAAFESINRIPRDWAMGRSYFELFGDLAEAPLIQQAFTQGQAWHGPLTHQTPDGRTIDSEVTVSPVRDPAGTIIGGLATATDVTRQNALQQQVRQAQKMEALGTLAGGITHDFNNILGAITINTELALLDMGPLDPARKTLPFVLQAANRGKDLVKQIITFSRQRAWERKPLPMAPIVKDGLELLRSTFPEGVSVREKIQHGSGVVLADPSHIHQILFNLCQNAVLAMRDGGGVLTIALERTEVDAAMADRNADLEPGPYIRLTVSDTGCGMERETLDRIFEPFFTTRERGKGTGLGLAVVHGIVKSYGGAITVQSQPRKGSVFSVYIPRLGDESVAVGSEPPLQAAEGTERIMVVEDEESQRTSLAKGLGRLGYEVTPAADGSSALAAFRENPAGFDLVITDQMMPRMSGLELAAELAKVRPGLPVILCTGFSEKVDAGTVGPSGVRELVMKPFTIAEVSRLIQKALETKGPEG